MFKQVIVVRADLKLSKGKMAAQTAHASLSAFEKADSKIAGKWKDTGQKKVVLKVQTLEDLLEIKKQCDKSKIPNALIKDAGHTEIEPGTVTALGVGPEDSGKIDKITGHLRMM